MFERLKQVWKPVHAVVAPAPGMTGDADVIGVRTTRRGSDRVDFAVTVRSRDTGWDRYADRLEAVGSDGRVMGERTLEHPHVDEQPFTRDLWGVRVQEPTRIVIRVHFKPTGFRGATKVVTVPEDAL